MYNCISENGFHHFADLASETDWSVIINLVFTAFLNSGESFAILQPLGMDPVPKDLRHIVDIGIAISSP